MNYLATPKTRLGAELFRTTRYSGGNTSEFYDETGFGVNLSQTVFTKGVVKAGAAYSVNDYNQPASGRADDNYRALIGFDYHIKEWLTTGVDYIYWSRDSTNSYYNFSDNRVMMTVWVTY